MLYVVYRNLMRQDTIITALQQPWRDGSKTFMDDFQTEVLKSLPQPALYNDEDSEKDDENRSSKSTQRSQASADLSADAELESSDDDGNPEPIQMSNESADSVLEGEELHTSFTKIAIRSCIKFSYHKFAILAIRTSDIRREPALDKRAQFREQRNNSLRKTNCHEVFSIAIAEVVCNF